MKAAEARFSPEFRNRIDEIIVFSPLTMDEVREIAKLYLAKVQRNMEQQGKSVEVTEAALDLLTEKGFSPAYGSKLPKTPHRSKGKAADHKRLESGDQVHRRRRGRRGDGQTGRNI